MEIQRSPCADHHAHKCSRKRANNNITKFTVQKTYLVIQNQELEKDHMMLNTGAIMAGGEMYFTGPSVKECSNRLRDWSPSGHCRQNQLPPPLDGN